MGTIKLKYILDNRLDILYKLFRICKFEPEHIATFIGTLYELSSGIKTDKKNNITSEKMNLNKDAIVCFSVEDGECIIKIKPGLKAM